MERHKRLIDPITDKPESAEPRDSRTNRHAPNSLARIASTMPFQCGNIRFDRIEQVIEFLSGQQFADQQEFASLEQHQESVRVASHPAKREQSLTLDELLLQRYPHERKNLVRIAPLFPTPMDDTSDDALEWGVWLLYPDGSLATHDRNYWGPLRTAYRWGAKNGHCKPRQITVRSQWNQRGPRELTATELAMLLSYLPEHITPIVQFLLEVGCTVKETLKLRWRDIESGRINFYGKNGRDVPLTPAAAAVLTALPRVDDFIFLTPSPFRHRYAIKDDTGGEIAEPLKRASAKAKIRQVRSRDLRDTWAIRRVAEGCSRKELKRLGGWADARSVCCYFPK